MIRLPCLPLTPALPSATRRACKRDRRHHHCGRRSAELVVLKRLANGMMKRIGKNYHQIIGINAGLIVSGIAGVLQPTTSALLHNTSTLLISLRSMRNLLTEE